MIRTAVLSLVLFSPLAFGADAPAKTPPVDAGSAASAKPRGLWFWSKPASPDGSVNIVGRPDREDEALALFRRWNIKRLYGSYANLPQSAPAALAAWNRKLHAQGIRSESLFADGKVIVPESREALLTAVSQRVLAFNAARADRVERFDGVALDVEAHALAAWKQAGPTAKRALLDDYLDTCAALRSYLDAHGGRGLPISAALAYWYDRLPPDGSIGWRSDADRDDWFGLLAQSVASISLMAYERHNAEGILEATMWERANFKRRVITALRARMGVEWRTIDDLRRVIPAVEAESAVGIDIENYELLRQAEAGGFARPGQAARPPAK
jgi:hypothetical protein